MATTYTGPRKRFLYVSDDSQTYVLSLDGDLSEAPFTAGLGLTESTTGVGAKRPEGLRPRRVYWRADDGSATKSFVSNADGEWYETSERTVVTIGGKAGKITGRTGEKLSY